MRHYRITDDDLKRALAVDRLNYYAAEEADEEERELLYDLADWLDKIKFAH